MKRSYTWHPQRPKWRYTCAFGVISFSVIIWLATRSEPEIWPRVISSIFALVGVFLFVEQETHIDKEAYSVIREGRLFGRFRLWVRRYSLSDFTEVRIKRQSDPETNDTVFVGLRRRSGRCMEISYYQAGRGQPSAEAERIAQSLSERTGLRLSENESGRRSF